MEATMLLVLMSMLALQEPPTIVWNTPAEPVVATPAAPPPTIPDWARADPFGYERSECSPLIRKADESLDACQSRVRIALAANLGDALPAGLRGGTFADDCRQAASGDSYGLQCGAQQRTGPTDVRPQERICTSRPVSSGRGGGVSFQEDCSLGRTSDEGGGLRFKLGGED